MNGIFNDQNMEQRSLPVLVFVLALCLATGFVIKEIYLDYFNLEQIWSDCCAWLHWRIIPGWPPH